MTIVKNRHNLQQRGKMMIIKIFIMKYHSYLNRTHQRPYPDPSPIQSNYTTFSLSYEHDHLWDESVVCYYGHVFSSVIHDIEC